MPTWLILAALGAIAVTALLIGALWRINLPLIEGRTTADGSTHGSDGGGD